MQVDFSSSSSSTFFSWIFIILNLKLFFFKYHIFMDVFNVLIQDF